MELAQTEAGAPSVDLALAEGATAPAGEGDASLPQEAALPGVKPDKSKAAEAAKSEEQKTAEAVLTAAKEETAKTEATAAKATDGPDSSPTGQVLENGGPILTAGTMPAEPIEPKDRKSVG